MNNPLRNGNFTSSVIVALTKKATNKKDFGAPAKTLITECNYERWLGDTLDTELESFPVILGKAMEERIFNLPDFDPTAQYTLTSDVTLQHPTIPFWAGSPDGFKEIDERSVFDFKAPSTKKSFVQLTLPHTLGMSGIEAMYAIRDGFNHEGFEYPAHKDGEKFYWQLVSNAIIAGCDWAELIVYMPYNSELLDILNGFGDDPRYRWIVNKPDIASLKDGGFFKNINVIRFEVPQADKDFLTEQVLKGGEMLITPKQDA
jgi:hypothetical protein